MRAKLFSCRPVWAGTLICDRSWLRCQRDAARFQPPPAQRVLHPFAWPPAPASQPADLINVPRVDMAGPSSWNIVRPSQLLVQRESPERTNERNCVHPEIAFLRCHNEMSMREISVARWFFPTRKPRRIRSKKRRKKYLACCNFHIRCGFLGNERNELVFVRDVRWGELLAMFSAGNYWTWR